VPHLEVALEANLELALEAKTTGLHVDVCTASELVVEHQAVLGRPKLDKYATQTLFPRHTRASGDRHQDHHPMLPTPERVER